jgi:hypothetical protein
MLLVLIQSTPRSRSHLLISALGGFIRGFLVGLISDGFDTGIITGATVAAINPLIISLEERLRERYATTETTIYDDAYIPVKNDF